tara:strand:- start:2497 stop:2883 length:387 start_codon:yes stop_codon:yes gene_type:complete
METALTAYLLSSASLTSLVGDRIAWSLRPQGFPSLTLQIVGGYPVDSGEGDSGLSSARLQADCYGKSSLQAKTLRDAVKTLLSGQQFTTGGVEFGVFTEDERELVGQEAGGIVVHRTSIDFLIWWATA